MNCPGPTTTGDFVNENQPEVHLRREDGSRVVTGPMPFVTILEAQVNPFRENEGTPNRKMLGIQQLFFACPNLRSFSISVYGNYGGCVLTVPKFPPVACFQMTGSEIFSPVEELSLDGYHHSFDEWAYWRDKFCWSDLKSLCLGPQPNVEFLRLINGHVTSLQSLTVRTYFDKGEDECSPLEDFLRSLNTLVSLDIKGHFLTSGAFSNHPHLKHFCLHTIESPSPGVSRKTLGGTGLYDLDINCPRLESLELDIDRDGEWPEDILRIIATGFENLVHLTLHLEVGIQDHYEDQTLFGIQSSYEPIEPQLTETTAKDLGQAFFHWRGESKLRTLSLKTGEPLRRFPQWEPFFARWEKCYAAHYILHAPLNPDDEPRLEDLTEMSPYYRSISHRYRAMAK